jgi:D-amino peptidase
VARERIRQGALLSLTELLPATPPTFARPISLEVTFLTADMAEMAGWLRGVECAGHDTRTARYTSADPLDVFRTFVTIVMLTRALVEA